MLMMLLMLLYDEKNQACALYSLQHGLRTPHKARVAKDASIWPKSEATLSQQTIRYLDNPRRVWIPASPHKKAAAAPS